MSVSADPCEPRDIKNWTWYGGLEVTGGSSLSCTAVTLVWGIRHSRGALALIALCVRRVPRQVPGTLRQQSGSDGGYSHGLRALALIAVATVGVGIARLT